MWGDGQVEDEVVILSRCVRLLDVVTQAAGGGVGLSLQNIRTDLLQVMKMCGARPDETAPFEGARGEGE